MYALLHFVKTESKEKKQNEGMSAYRKYIDQLCDFSSYMQLQLLAPTIVGYFDTLLNKIFFKSNMIESNHIIKFTFDVKLMVELALKVVYTAALYVLWTRNVTKTSSLNCTAIQSVKMPFEAEHACVERSVGKLQIHFTCEKVLNSQLFHRHVCTCISLLRVASLDKCVNF